MMMLISLVYLLTLGMAMIASDNVAVMLLFMSAGILLGTYLRHMREIDAESIDEASTAGDSSDLADVVSRLQRTGYTTPPHPHCPRCGFSGYDPSRPCNACGYSTGGVSINT
jgi:hypothetical protein